MKGELETSEKEYVVQLLLSSGRSFALYRPPQTMEPRLLLQIEGQARPLSDHEEPRGFLFAPFLNGKECPTLLIEPTVKALGWQRIQQQVVHSLRMGNTPGEEKQLDVLPFNESQPDGYQQFFQQAVEALKDGTLEKIVAADWQIGKHENHLRGREAHMFCKALDSFPDSMISLVYTPTSGCWIGITPEVLLEKTPYGWHTMALAGTNLTDNGSWDKKNIVEHQTVSRYLQDTLKRLNVPYTASKPYTRQAGRLYHLCTDFQLPCRLPVSTMKMLRTLHPTPAVCGMPKEEARSFICNNEHIERNYYCGYLGPVNTIFGTHLYVNLRCAQIRSGHTVYYAGGGLNHMSEFQAEHEEIARKIDTLKLLAHD